MCNYSYMVLTMSLRNPTIENVFKRDVLNFSIHFLIIYCFDMISNKHSEGKLSGNKVTR